MVCAQTNQQESLLLLHPRPLLENNQMFLIQLSSEAQRRQVLYSSFTLCADERRHQ